MGVENAHAAPRQKLHHVESARAFSDLCNEDQEGILTRIVIGDETWVHHYEPEPKQDYVQWHKKGIPPSKKFKVSQSAGTLMATVFSDTEGILLIDFMDKGVNIIEEYHALILEHLREAIKEKRRGKLTKGVMLLHDNVPVHKSLVALAALLNHPPCSPDLPPNHVRMTDQNVKFVIKVK